MKAIQKITSWVKKARYIYWRNKYSRMKHITALIRMIEKESNIAKERSQGISGRLSQLKLSVKKLKESKTTTEKDICALDYEIDQLRKAFHESVKSHDHLCKTTDKRFHEFERLMHHYKKTTEKEMDVIERRVANAQLYEENTEKLLKMQNTIEQKCENYIRDFQERWASIHTIDKQFRDAMSIQCQDILRRVNQQLSPQSKPNGHVHQ